MKNFDSVPQVQRFSNMHQSLCGKITSWLIHVNVDTRQWSQSFAQAEQSAAADIS